MPTREFSQLQAAFGQMCRASTRNARALDAQMAEQRRMREELQSLQRQVIRQERLAAVGQLVSGVAHEINNPLQAILGFAELLQMQATCPTTVKTISFLIQKESAAPAASSGTSRCSRGSRPAPPRPPTCAATSSPRSPSSVSAGSRSEDIELRVEDESKQQVLAVLTELQQVVLNFVVNAEQAIVMSGRRPGRITVRTRDEGDRVIIEVEDTGPAFPRRQRGQAVPAVLHDQAGRSGNRPRPLGQLRHHRLARRAHRLPPGPRRRRDLLLRSARASARR